MGGKFVNHSIQNKYVKHYLNQYTKKYHTYHGDTYAEIAMILSAIILAILVLVLVIFTIKYIKRCHRQTEPNKEVCEECHDQIGIETCPEHLQMKDVN